MSKDKDPNETTEPKGGNGVSPERDKAEIARIYAEIKRIDLEATRAELENETVKIANRMAESETQQSELRAATARVLHQREFAQDRYHHVYQFSQSVTEQTVRKALDELSVWHRTSPGCDIEIVIDSPGGSVIDGMDLFDYIRDLSKQGHFVTTHARGYAASMGGILLQAGDRRVIGEEAYVLIHQISTGVFGKVGELKDEMKFIEKMGTRILNIFADRSRDAFANGTAEVALTAEQFANGDSGIGISGWERTDWWLDSAECLRYGIVDEVR